MIKIAILVQRKNKKTNKLEWALVSRKDRKVLKWFGAKKPSKERVQKEERRIQFFKHQSIIAPDIIKVAFIMDNNLKDEDSISELCKMADYFCVVGKQELVKEIDSYIFGDKND